jgi:Amt family ammonium transporter
MSARMKNSTKRAVVVLFAVFCMTPLAFAQAPAANPAAAPAATAAAPPAPAPRAITDSDLAGAPVPPAEAHAKGDPDGSITGNSSDITVSDAKKGLTIGDLANQVGQNKIAVNFVWTLITGYLVMFMQLGFALLETGLARAKNANHTMMMNIAVYGIGMFAYWLIGFAIQMGGVGAVANLGGTAPLSAEFTATIFGKPFGLFGQHGLFLMHKGTYDVGVMVLFLFQMVFMDTGATIPTGAAVERWKFSAFIVTSFLFAAFTYPLFANWAWGGGWLANLGANFGLGKGYCDFAGSGVVHAVGGLSALAIAMILGPRIGKFSREGRPQVILAHDIVLVITGCLILAFGWFGFNPGSTLGASSNGNLRIGSIAVNTMLASAMGMISAMLYMWFMYKKPDASMTGNGFLAGLVAITAPSGFVNPLGAVIIGFIAGVLVCLSVAFVERVLQVDDPVGAVSVHGTCGIWGVISLGLFADGKSNYGGAWNGVNGSVTGLFYGDASQLVAQLIGVATLVGFVFTLSFIFAFVVDLLVGQRTSAKSELEGLDLPEMGALAYPEFELKS